mmetsp:Transcript_69103/g.191360  ORF Transcript_69103/g.191360 Transcript_69103/m.191360 type:complete len:211 (-) Transcript_69103:280-912(-)
MFSCKACSPGDRTTDVVQFDASAIAREQELAEQAAREREEQRRMQEEHRRLAEEARRVEQEQWRLQEEEVARQADEEARLEREERERLAREALEREDAARRAEETRLEWEAAKARRASVAGFLREKGFKNGAGGAKKSLMSTTYPLHVAAKEGDARIVALLLSEGANAAQRNSTGKTAAQIAEKSNKGGSHAAVLAALATPSAAARAGGC